MKKEQLIATRVANYLQVNYPHIPFRFDIAADLPMSIGQARRIKSLHGKYNKGHPDLVIYTPNGAVFIELKATKTVEKSKHTDTQKAYHRMLRELGYKVDFACGFNQAKEQIDKYLT